MKKKTHNNNNKKKKTDNKNLLYNTGNYTQYFVITYRG